MYLPPVLAPKKDLMSRKIMQVDVFVMLMHALYTHSSYLLVFSRFRIYLWLFLLKKYIICVFTPGFGPKEGLNEP